MNSPNIKKEHAVETYKSLIQISVEGMKILALLNGGAAVALLAYLGNLANKSSTMPDMRCPMAFFLLGLVLCGVCFITSYLTQFSLYNESKGFPIKEFYQNHKFWLYTTIFFAAMSILAFAAGSLSAVVRFQ